MDLNLWCIFTSLLLASVGAVRFDLGPQKFTESASPSPREEQTTVTNDIVLYLTSDQIEALEASGAVVRPAESESDDASGDRTEEKNLGEYSEPEQSPDNVENNENDQNISEEIPDQNEQPELELAVDDFNGDLNFEEIFRILNEERLEEEEEEEQPRNAPQVVEENVEEPREIPPRFLAREKQQSQEKQRQDRYLDATDNKARSKIYSAIRYQQSNEQPQKSRVQISLPQVQAPVDSEEESREEELQRVTPSPLRRFRLVPYETEENVEKSIKEQLEQPTEQQPQEELEPQEEQDQSEEEEETENENTKLSPLPDRLTKVIGQRKNKLLQNELELQAALRDLKQSKHNDQKYAIEIEKLKVNLEKQNTLSKAEAIAKAAPQLIKKEIQKRRPNNSAKQSKVIARNPELQKSKALKPQPVKVEIEKPVPALKKQRVETEKSVPVEVEKRVPVAVTRNVYVKVKKPYLVESSEIPVRKNEKITILRHIWEH